MECGLMGSADQSGCHRGSRRGVGWNRLMISRGSHSRTCSAGDVPEQWLFSVSATPTPLLDLARSIINASLAGMRTCVRILLKNCRHQSPSPSRRSLSAATCSGPSRLLGCGRAARGGAPRLLRERSARRRPVWFALEGARHSARDAWPAARLPLALPCLIRVFGASAGPCLGFAFPRRAERHAGSPRLGQADRNRLLRRSCPVLAAANLSDLLMHEFAGLG